MLTKYKKSLIVTSLVILLPMLYGLLLWDKLPQVLTTHWGFEGNANGTSSRSFVVFGLPGVMLLLQWFCVFATARDPKNREKNGKIMKLMLWIIPIVSNLVVGLVYSVSLGHRISPVGVALVLVGAILLAVGNYLPKCSQNSTLGIKVRWVYTSQENWNATHRFGGKVWVAGGLGLMVLGFLSEKVGPWPVGCLLLLMLLLPVAYSFLFFRREKGEEGR